MAELTQEALYAIMRSVLYTDEELPQDGSLPEDVVRVEGVINNYGFHPQRLAAAKPQIDALLLELPGTFQKDKDGGWSFLSACVDKDDHLWGQHRDIEQLVCLGIGVGSSLMDNERAYGGNAWWLAVFSSTYMKRSRNVLLLVPLAALAAGCDQSPRRFESAEQCYTYTQDASRCQKLSESTTTHGGSSFVYTGHGGSGAVYSSPSSPVRAGFGASARAMSSVASVGG